MKAARTILKNIGSMKISFWCADPQHENDRKVFGEPRSLPPGIRGAGEGRDRCKSCYNKELALRKQAIQNAELRGLLPKHAKRTVRSYSSADQGSRTSEPVDNTARLSRMASSSSSSSSSNNRFSCEFSRAPRSNSSLRTKDSDGLLEHTPGEGATALSKPSTLCNKQRARRAAPSCLTPHKAESGRYARSCAKCAC